MSDVVDSKNIMYPGESVVIITLDSLRYDVAMRSFYTHRTPYLRWLIERYGVNTKTWARVYSQGTSTLPSHVTWMQSGHFPNNNKAGVPWPYNSGDCAFLRFHNPDRPKPAGLILETDDNIPRAFERHCYRCLGVGGVGWFELNRPTCRIWSQYFSEIHWRHEFDENHPDGFEQQIRHLERIGAANDKRPLFLFLNVASTHSPYCGFPKTRDGQASALSVVDQHMDRLIGWIPRPAHVLVFGDHGECFGEDGMWGHGFYHPKVMEVPMAYLRIQ